MGEYPVGFALNELAALERATGDNAKGAIGESDCDRLEAADGQRYANDGD